MDKQTLYRVIIVVFVAILIGSTLAIFFIHPSGGYSEQNKPVNETRGLATWNLTLQSYQPYLVVSGGCFNRSVLLHLPGVVRVVPSKDSYAVALGADANMTALFIRLSNHGCRVVARAVLQFPRTYGNYSVRGSGEVVAIQPIYRVGDKVPVQVEFYAIPSQKVVYPFYIQVSTVTRRLTGHLYFTKLLSERCYYVPKNSSANQRPLFVIKRTLFNCTSYGNVKNVTYQYGAVIHTLFNQTINTTLFVNKSYQLGKAYNCTFSAQYTYPLTDVWDVSILTNRQHTQ